MRVALNLVKKEEAEALSTAEGFPLFLALGLILQGAMLARQGQSAVGIEQMRQGLTAFRATGTEMLRPYFLALLAEAYGAVGQTEEGLAVVAEALETVDKTGERFYEAELWRLTGELTLARARGWGLGTSPLLPPSPKSQISSP